MAVRMKVRCSSRTEMLGSHWDAETKVHTPVTLYGYQFSFVTGAESPENAAFWSATPSGTFSLSTVLQDAFELGQHYYVDVHPCPND